MASNKKYKCPFCKLHDTKEKLIYHIDKKHEDMIPEGFTAARILFHYIHKKPISEKGRCVICHNDTNWNEKTYKYNRLCDRRECKEKLRENYKKNMLRVFGTYNILNDMNQQEKMLKNRSISGIYKFRNGKIKDYVGSYEKKFLEFCDLMLGFDPDDIIMPGPTIEYEYKGQKHVWITDALIVPYNLVLDIKDGGSNPNNREMNSYREKQIEKEKVITNKGEYNYLRLTDNQFPQLIAIIYELKLQMLDDPDTIKTISRVHESTNNISLYHISEKDIDGNTLIPRIPSNYFTKNGFEDDTTPRVSFSTSIQGCLMGLSQNCKGKTYYVYSPETNIDNKNIYKPNTKEVPDSKITKEVWVLQPVKIKKVCKIYVKSDTGEDGIKFSYGNKTAELYKWDYEIIQESSQPLLISEKDVEYRVDDFKNHKVPVLWITGMSGGGKTTTAHKMADEMNCDLVEIDSIEGFFRLLSKTNKEKEIKRIIDQDKNFKIVYDFCNKNNQLLEDINNHELQDKEYFKRLFNWEYQIVKLILKRYNSNNPVIFEGCQIPYLYYKDKSLFRNCAIIIKGTSTVTSFIRRIKRDGKEFISSLDDIFMDIKMYKDWHNDIGEFRDKAIKESSNTMKTITEAVKIPEIKPEDIKYINGTNGVSNSYIDYKGKHYRVRVETLVINDGKVYLQKSDTINKYGTKYKIPGGSAEAKCDLITQASNECKEESKLNVKNIYYTGKYYLTNYKPGTEPSYQINYLWPLGFKYAGSLTYIYIAEYNGHYNGYIRKADRDDLYKYGKFYDPEDIKWLPEHKQSLEDYFKFHKVLKESSDTMKTITEAVKIPEIKPEDIQFIKGYDGTNHAYIIYKGNNYRVRVETLIVNDKGDVYIDKSDKYAKYGIQYRIPGGSVEPDRDFVTQAENECKEEVHINIKNAYYSGQNWVMLFPPNSNSGIPNFSYKGCISYIYVAEYNGKYHGYVKVADRDDMYKTGKFYKYKDVKWLPEHKKALEDYFKSHKVLKESSDTMDDVIRTGKDQLIQFALRRKGTKFRNYKLDSIGEEIPKIRKLDYNDQEYYKYLKIHEVRLKASFNDRIYALKNALLLSKEQCEELKERILKHDASRYTPEEWDDWRKSYFPINDKEKEEGEESEKKARSHHYKVNAHHPEHWKGKEMDKVSIAEMIIDWEADSKADGGNPLKWWLYDDEAKEKKKLLNPKTREEVERVLQTIYDVDMNLKDNFDRFDDPKKAE